jgi:hypothetical protein
VPHSLRSKGWLKITADAERSASFPLYRSKTFHSGYASAAVAGTSQAVYATGTEIGQDASAWLYRIGWGEILESISEHAQDIVDMFRGPFGRW